MDIDKILFDCRYFKGVIPCKPNKESNKICNTCDAYAPVNKRILIIKLGAIGDVIRTTPLLTRFRAAYPACHITWLTHSTEILPDEKIDEILKADGLAFYQLRNLSFDLAVNLDKDREACMLLSEIKADQKYGFIWKDGHIHAIGSAAEEKLITGLYDNISKNNKKSYLEEIFSICGFQFNGEEYLIHLDKSSATKWKTRLKKRANGRIIAGLNTGCGARWKTRLWPDEYWTELAGKLTRKGYYCLLLGGAAEDEKNKRIASNAEAFYPGHFPLRDFISMCDATDVIVTQVSMMMHIAIALKKKIILLNNIFNKHEFELYGRGRIIEPETGCDCYFGNVCSRKKHCMQDISSHKVALSVEKILPPK